MAKRLLDIGNCGPDHGALSDLLQTHFDLEIDQAHGEADAIAAMRSQAYDLVTVNRVMDRDGASGLDIISTVKSDAELGTTPVMLISNYKEYQQKAIALGAEPGFGKNDLHLQETVAMFEPYLN